MTLVPCAEMHLIVADIHLNINIMLLPVRLWHVLAIVILLSPFLVLQVIHLIGNGRLVGGSSGSDSAYRAENVCSLTARHWLDGLHGTLSEGIPVIDGFLVCKSTMSDNQGYTAKLANGTLIIPDSIIEINKTWSAFEVALHLEQHSIVWPGWKHVAEPLRIRAAGSDFSDIRCDEVVYSPSIFYGLLAFPMYGHVMFNGHSNLVDTIHKSGLAVGSLRMYAALDNPSSMISADELGEFVHLGSLQEPFIRLTKDAVIHSYHTLLRESFNKAICFSNQFVVGLSGGLDHYNFSIPGSAWAEYGRFMTDLMGLPQSYLSTTAESACVVTIISRSKNRQILNEHQLVAVSRQQNCTAQVVNFESCTFTEQLAFMRNSTVVVGIDGSGLLNAAFMRKCSAVIRIMPWGCCDERIGNLQHKGQNFKNLGEKVAGTWISHCITDRRHTVFHQNSGPGIFHILNRSVAGINTKVSIDDASLNIAKKFNHEQRNRFFMAQDSIVEPTAFATLIKRAIEKNIVCQLQQQAI